MRCVDCGVVAQIQPTMVTWIYLPSKVGLVFGARSTERGPVVGPEPSRHTPFGSMVVFPMT